MISDVAEVERALLALAPGERAAVIERGLRSLDEVDQVDQAAIDAAWSTEINRRLNEYTSGSARLVDLDEHFDRLRAKLATRGR